ncbi:methyltransferase domain-containing protein [Amycolatopsis sp. WGS_07]|uniref:methyltransferase domain-containing protein n=1 Tax=Amycolatopsis sp. WGS_07 TaxID=3076764 RepID=UPI0038733EAB
MPAPYVPAKEEVAQFYDQAIPMITRLVGVNVHVGYWDSPEDTSSVQEATDRLTDLMTARLRLSPGQRVLDVGCGLGAPALRLAAATGAHVVGIATSPNLVKAATAAAEDAGLDGQVRFEVADAAELPYPPSAFDAVLAIESLVHMSDRPKVFSEIARVLRPGGRLSLTDCVEKVAPTESERAIVESYRRFALNSPLLRLGEYLDLLSESGLLPLEYLDITAETARHQVHMMAQVERQSAELTELYGPEMVAAYKAVFEGVLEAGVPVYMLVTAERAKD